MNFEDKLIYMLLRESGKDCVGGPEAKTINVDYVNVTKRKKREAVEDEARRKVRQRTKGKNLSPTEVGTRMGRAAHWAGTEYIRRGTDVNEGGSFQDKLISVLLSEEEWQGKQKKEREKSKREQQWRTFKYKTKSGKPATLQVQKRKHQEQQYNLDDFEQPIHNVKRARVTHQAPASMGVKGKMVHHTTSRPQTSPHSLWQQGNPDTSLIAPKSVKRHTTVTAKLPGGKQVRNKRFPTSHDKDPRFDEGFRDWVGRLKQKPGEWTEARKKRASDRAVRKAHKKAERDRVNAMMAQTDTKDPKVIKNDAERAEFNRSMDSK